LGYQSITVALVIVCAPCMAGQRPDDVLISLLIFNLFRRVGPNDAAMSA
jgi:hypothetical protein